MKILLVDTTTKDLVVMVVDGEKIIDKTVKNAGTHHSELLCDTVAAAMSDAKVKFDQLDAYACAIGPGSFTGIRIGIATVKGYQAACPKKLISLNCLQAIAASKNLGAKGKAVIDAGNGYYFADYTAEIAPCLVGYDDECVQGAAKGSVATEYADGLVELAKKAWERGEFASSLSPLYIRKSQAEEKR